MEKNEEKVITEKNKLISVQNPVTAYQVLVANASPAYLITLHKLLDTIVECAKEVKMAA